MVTSLILPQQTVFSEFLQFPAALTDPMRALIIGGQAQLTRYAYAAEKPLALLTAYDYLNNHTYPYPNRTAGSIVDQKYTAMFVDNALLMYLNKQVGVGGTVLPVSGYSNRVRASAIAFAADGTSWPRNAIFGDRDCEIGDIVDLTAVISGTTYFTRTSIIGFIADKVAASTGAATSLTGNAVTQVASAVGTKTAGASNYITLTASATNYNGSVTGQVNETYTIEVTQGSISGNLTTARLKIISASGLDNYYPLNGDGSYGVIPSAVGNATIITARGATITFTLNTGAYVTPGVTSSDLIVGQVWSVVVNEAWTAPVATSGGTYTGTINTTYTITVQEGGFYWQYQPGAQGAQGAQAGLIGPQYVTGPLIVVTTSNGYDAGGPYIVPQGGTVTIGNYGVNITFSGTGLCAGDRYQVICTAAGNGPYQTLVLNNNLPTAMLGASDIAIKLYIEKQGLPITIDRTASPPALNWTQDGNYVYVNSGILAYDPTYTFSGVLTPLPLVAGNIYIQTRQWLQSQINNIFSVNTVAQIQAQVGTITPDNPLAWALNLAMLNASGSTIYYGAVSNPALSASWINFLPAITNISGFYNLVPLTRDSTALTAFYNHIISQSSPEVGAYRCGWFGLKSRSIKPVVTQATTTDGNVATATITADPVTGLLTLLQVTSNSNAKFKTVNVVQPGDLVYLSFSQDGFGNVTYTPYTVASIANDDTLSLSTPVPAVIVTGQKFEVWHPMSQNDITNDLLAQAAPFTNTRIRMVWPDQADGNDGTFICAALAGEASGICIQQGMRNLQLLGFTTLQSRSLPLTGANIQTLISNGIWIVNTDPTGVIYSQSAVTTDITSTITVNEVIQRNADAQTFYILNQVAQYIGTSNVVPGTLTLVRNAIQAAFNFLESSGTSAKRLGPPLLDGSFIVSPQPHAILKDRIVTTIGLQLPYPFNQLVLTVQIVA